ncbi:unnamed protein product [Adineta steineri]|uniref:Uncharacterized protein n=1 Tax=Adineta steineri TaxID=433720 RepID=A0A815UWD6_9BILA|nr:unnamed protein product [Adineta steineri]CAF1519563.1 unnamed protein product [Adineta steineri]
MSSSVLEDIQSKLIIYGYSSVMSFRIIDHIFVIRIVIRQRENACSIYLLSSAIFNVFCLIFYGFTQIYLINYSSETPAAFGLCKTYIYL